MRFHGSFLLGYSASHPWCTLGLSQLWGETGTETAMQRTIISLFTVLICPAASATLFSHRLSGVCFTNSIAE